jgi:hypothetical protein
MNWKELKMIMAVVNNMMEYDHLLGNGSVNTA